MKFVISLLTLLLGLSSCSLPTDDSFASIVVTSDESGNTDYLNSGDAPRPEPFQPDMSSGFWQQRLQYELGHQEMSRAQEATDAIFRRLGQGRLHARPTVDVAVTSGFDGNTRYTAIVQTRVSARYSVSNTAKFEKIEEHLFRDHVGIFTNSEKIAGHFRQECRKLCSEGRFEIGGQVTILGAAGSKRRDVCHLRGSLHHHSESGREQYCDVFQQNSEVCATALPRFHPVAGCEYHDASLVGQVTTEIVCNFDSGWKCEVKNVQAAECSEAKATPGTSNYCELVRDILTPRDRADCVAKNVFWRTSRRTKEVCEGLYADRHVHVGFTEKLSPAWMFDEERKHMTQALLEKHCEW